MTDHQDLITRSVARAARAVPDTVKHQLIGRLHPRVEPLVSVVASAVDRSGRALDIGAWWGPWTYRLSRRVRFVETFEPNPVLADALRRSVRANVTVHEVAASDATQQTTLSLPHAGLGSEGTGTVHAEIEAAVRYEVDAVPIDDFGFDNVVLVKIDVEGHELQVLTGAHRLLEQHSPVLVVEMDSRLGELAPTSDFLADHGYRGRWLRDGRWIDYEAGEFVEWQQANRHLGDSSGYLRDAIRGSRWVNDVVWVHPRSTWAPW